MQFFDVITAVTLAGIIAILTLYVVVVYKKGWLRRNSKGSESYFLCPNSKCRRVFKDPIWLTDLSKTPPESYQACPHCSISLQLSPSFRANESLEFESAPSAPRFNKGLRTSERAPDIQKENASERKGIMRETSKQTFQTDRYKGPEKSAPVQQPRELAPVADFRREPPSKLVEASKKHDEKNVSERPRACSHYFGYVRTLPKNTSIPDECLWCPWIVKCLTGTEKVEA